MAVASRTLERLVGLAVERLVQMGVAAATAQVTHAEVAVARTVADVLGRSGTCLFRHDRCVVGGVRIRVDVVS